MELANSDLALAGVGAAGAIAGAVLQRRWSVRDRKRQDEKDYEVARQSRLALWREERHGIYRQLYQAVKSANWHLNNFTKLKRENFSAHEELRDKVADHYHRQVAEARRCLGLLVLSGSLDVNEAAEKALAALDEAFELFDFFDQVPSGDANEIKISAIKALHQAMLRQLGLDEDSPPTPAPPR